jgi:hypothetical protein
MAKYSIPAVVNTNTQTQYLATPEVKGDNGDFSLQVVVSRTSGAAGGTVTPEYSLDGTNFITIPGTSAFTLSDTATQSQIWAIVDRKAPFYRLKVSTTATGVVSSTGFYVGEESHR